MSVVEVEERGAVLQVTINRPEKRNALTQEVADSLFDAWQRLENEDFAVAVVTGAGDKAFCAGADFNDPALNDGVAYPNFSVKVSKPIIAAVEGYAVGAGFVLCQSADIVVASRTAQLGYPEARIGVTGGGGSFIASRLPAKVAYDLLLTGQFYDGERALSAGLVSRLVEPGDALKVANELADQIAGNHADSVRLLKLMLDRDYQTTSVESAQFLANYAAKTSDKSRLTESKGLKGR